MTQQISRTYFDYNALPDKNTRAVLRSEATAIKAAVKRTHDNIIEIGNRLRHAKELAGHGQFSVWIDAEFGMTDRHARSFIQVAEVFSNRNNCSDLKLSQSAIFALSSPSIDEETRDIIIEEAHAGNIKTTADVKEWAEAAKPIQPTATHSIPTPPSDADFDDSDPFDDIDLVPEVGNFEPEAEAENNPGTPYDPDEDLPVIEVEEPKSTTLKERVKNAEVFHDTLGTAQKAEELDDDAWLETLPIYRVLKQKQHRGLFLKRDLIATRHLLEPLNTFEHHARRAFDFKNPSGTPAETRVVHLAAMPRPLDWQVCAPCKGNGCNRCAHSGYDVTGAGISPLRVESGEAVL